MAAEVGAAPAMAQLQSVQKAMALPTVGAAVGQVSAFYTRVKGIFTLVNLFLYSLTYHDTQQMFLGLI